MKNLFILLSRSRLLLRQLLGKVGLKCDGYSVCGQVAKVCMLFKWDPNYL